MSSIAILLTCHNRKNKTLSSLKTIYSQQGVENYKIDIYLVDDGSTDGTSEEVIKQYPSVNLIQGDGDLFWNRGMHLAWTTATQQKEYDYYLWLNDDTTLLDHAFKILLASSNLVLNKAIICGTTCKDNTQTIRTYGGTYKGSLISPNDNLQRCDLFNGNIVLIPKYVYESIGVNDPYYNHALGDFDYALMANEKKIKIYVAPGYIGLCKRNEKSVPWSDPSVPFRERYKNLYSPLGYSHPKEFFYFNKKHYGYTKALIHITKIHIRLMFPSLWNKIRINIHYSTPQK